MKTLILFFSFLVFQAQAEKKPDLLFEQFGFSDPLFMSFGLDYCSDELLPGKYLCATSFKFLKEDFCSDLEETYKTQKPMRDGFLKILANKPEPKSVEEMAEEVFGKKPKE